MGSFYAVIGLPPLAFVTEITAPSASENFAEWYGSVFEGQLRHYKRVAHLIKDNLLVHVIKDFTHN